MKRKKQKPEPKDVISEQMLTVRVPNTLMKSLNSSSKKQGLSRSDFVRSALERAVA